MRPKLLAFCQVESRKWLFKVCRNLSFIVVRSEGEGKSSGSRGRLWNARRTLAVTHGGCCHRQDQLGLCEDKVWEETLFWDRCLACVGGMVLTVALETKMIRLPQCSRPVQTCSVHASIDAYTYVINSGFIFTVAKGSVCLLYPCTLLHCIVWVIIGTRLCLWDALWQSVVKDIWLWVFTRFPGLHWHW